MLSPEVKAQWTTALRSGKYKQGQGGLKIGSCFCCLGVLCDINGVEWTESSENVSDIAKYDGHTDHLYLPVSLRRELGLTHEEEVILSNMNDGWDGKTRTFEQIADHIETNL